MSVSTMLRKDNAGTLLRAGLLKHGAVRQFKSVEELRGASKPGDIVFTRAVEPGLYSRLVSARQGSNFGHSALYLGGGKVIDTTIGDGVHFTTIDKLRKYERGRDIRMVSPRVTDEERDAAISIAKSYIGTPYSMKELSGVLIRAGKNVHDKALDEKKDALICSQLITRAYPDLNVAPDKYRDHVMPVDIDRSNATKRIGELMADKKKTAGLANMAEQLTAHVNKPSAILEAGALGTLAAPSADKLIARHRARRAGMADSGGHVSEKAVEKFRVFKPHHEDAMEVAGLGALAAPYVHRLMKRAGAVSIPKGGLRPGMLMNDLTQVMSKEDAELVREKLPFYKRSGPGLLPAAVIGAQSGAALGSSIHGLINYNAKVFGRGAGIGAAIGGVALPAVAYLMTRAGKYDRGALAAAEKAIETAKSQITKKAMVDELRELGVLTAGQLEKLSSITDERATESLNRLNKLKRDKPTLGQIGRGAAIGATVMPAASIVARAIAGRKATGLPLYRGHRDLASMAIHGAAMGGVLPAARHRVEQHAETKTIKRYLNEHGVEDA